MVTNPAHLNENNAFEIVFARGEKDIPSSSFIRWLLSLKFDVIQQLFQLYLYPECRFIDIACGDGDGLVLAQSCESNCELWGIDIEHESLKIAASRIPKARLFAGDIYRLDFLPEGYFDVLHEFGATYLLRDWKKVIQQYLRLVRDGGIILWELPRKWSMAHLMYLCSVAPKISKKDTKIKQFFRSFSPSKYIFLSDKQIEKCLQVSDYKFEVIDRVPIWYFFCHGPFLILIDYLHLIGGDRLFEMLNYINGFIWPRHSGFYLVIRKKHKSGAFMKHSK